MTHFWLIGAMALVMFGLRFGGLLLPNVTIPQSWETGLRFLPVALLSALVTVSLTGAMRGDPAALAGAGVGGLLAWRTRRMWACIAVGMLAYWLLGAF